MPQMFQVLKCYKCSVFQVHQTKKSNKWECKLCGAKQSIKRHYGLGTGKECRLHVQKLNGIRGEVEDLNKSVESETSELEVEYKNFTHDLAINTQISNKTRTTKVSKWSHFTDEPEFVEEQQINEGMSFGNTEVVLEIPAKKRKKFNMPKVIQKSTACRTPQKTELSEAKEIEYQPDYMTLGNSDFAVSISSTFPIANVTNSSKVNATKMLKCEVPRTFISSTPNTENNDNEIREMPTNFETKTTSYMPPKVKNSKWAQFTEGSAEDEIQPSLTRENFNKPNNLYSLCDEKEIDDVLNF